MYINSIANSGLFKVFSDNILVRPEFFISLIVLVCYLFLRRPIHETFAGTMKCIIGIMIWNVGADGLVNTFRPILAGLNDRFHMNAAVIDPYFGLAAANKSLGTLASMVMIALMFAFLWNLVLVAFGKITKIRTLFLTGHIMLQQATTATFIVFFALPAYANATGAIIVGFLVGTYQAVFSNLTVEACNNLTDNAGFAVGHQQMGAIWLTDKIAGKLGNKDKNLDNIKLPKSLSIFNDNVVTAGTLMLVFFGIIMCVLGEPYMRGLENPIINGVLVPSGNFPKTLSFPAYIINRSLTFSVYLFILMSGVRMFVAELTTAFQGISDKFIPGLTPAVDCAATYGYGAKNAVVYGFIFGALGQFIAIAGLLIFHSPIMIITGFVPVFFDNATLAVFANKRGGVRAATIIPICCGIIQVLGGAFAMWFFGAGVQSPLTGGWHGSIDWDTIWPAFGVFANTFKIFGVFALIVAMLVIPQIQYRKNKTTYFAKPEDLDA